MEADGGVYHGQRHADRRGDRAVYTFDNNIAVLTGDVVLVKGKDVARGDKLTVNTKTNDAKLESNARARPRKRRVRAVFYQDEAKKLPTRRPRPLNPPPRARTLAFMTLTSNDMDGLFVDSVGKSFGDRPVVKNVSLRLKRGEVAGLLGPNGAGKTTCFYMITGLIAADYGAIYLDGENITAQPMFQRARLGVGYLPQEASIFRGMTVEQNVMAVVEMRQKDQRKAREQVTSILEELRITHIRKSPAVALSGGERRRVEIARALASEPSFMLLDEPFAGIDPWPSPTSAR
jgi:LPS export ABC transporter ATP-binding protein